MMNLHDLTTTHLIVGIAAVGIPLGTVVLYLEFGEVGLQAASIVTTGLLTLALVALYFQQYTVLDRQTELMEWDFESAIAYRGQITAEDEYIHIELKNNGRGAIGLMYLKAEITSDTGSLEIEPGYSQLHSVEDENNTLPGLCPPKEFKARVNFSYEYREGKKNYVPFEYISRELIQEGIEKCTIRLTIEVDDEGTKSEEDIEEVEIAEQEIEFSEPTTLSEAIVIKIRPREDILPHDYPEYLPD